MPARQTVIRFLCVVITIGLFQFGGQAAPVALHVDATQAARKIFYADEVIPVTPGPITLVFPKWIPGEHAPTGPITDLAGLRFIAAGKTLEWKRDDVDMYAFHLQIPAGVTSLDVKLEQLLASAPEGFSSAASTTSELSIVSWNQLLLYPQGKASNDVEFSAQLHLPDGWKFGTALPVARTGANNNVESDTVSLSTLVDSPVLAGKHFRRFELTPGSTPAHYLEVAADSDEALNARSELIDKYRRLVKEALALYGNSVHYREYHFLLALSDQIAHFGLEHHQSSDDQAREDYLIDDAVHLSESSLLPHEFMHSWNGKYRRPQGLATPDYQTPMKGDLLWVYEGLDRISRVGVDRALRPRHRR